MIPREDYQGFWVYSPIDLALLSTKPYELAASAGAGLTDAEIELALSWPSAIPLSENEFAGHRKVADAATRKEAARREAQVRVLREHLLGAFGYLAELCSELEHCKHSFRSDLGNCLVCLAMSEVRKARATLAQAPAKQEGKLGETQEEKA